MRALDLFELVGELRTLWRAFRAPPRYTPEELDRLNAELDEAVKAWEEEGDYSR